MSESRMLLLQEISEWALVIALAIGAMWVVAYYSGKMGHGERVTMIFACLFGFTMIFFTKAIGDGSPWPWSLLEILILPAIMAAVWGIVGFVMWCAQKDEAEQKRQ